MQIKYITLGLFVAAVATQAAELASVANTGVHAQAIAAQTLNDAHVGEILRNADVNAVTLKRAVLARRRLGRVTRRSENEPDEEEEDENEADENENEADENEADENENEADENEADENENEADEEEADENENEADENEADENENEADEEEADENEVDESSASKAL